MSLLPSSVTAGRQIAMARIFTATLGCAAIAWGLANLPMFWRQMTPENIARHILLGESYKTDVLLRQLSVLEAAEDGAKCRPIALRSTAIVRLRLMEEPSRNGVERPLEAQQLQALDNSIRSSLACSPADPFLWLVLYWVENSLNGTKSEYLNYLRMSYRLGPNEAWIIFKRSPVSFASFAELPADLATEPIRELLVLIKNELYQPAVEIFSGPAWQIRDTILPYLASLPRRNREAFARVVRDKGLDVTIPGVDPPKSHPWH